MKKILISTLLFIWQLPQFIVALIMFPFLGKKVKVADRHYNRCWKCEKMRGGISLGPFSFVSPTMSNESIMHEVDGHTVDSKLFGPLYLLIIGLPSLIHAWIYDPYTSCYYNFYTERRANRFAGLKVTDRCRLVLDK